MTKWSLGYQLLVSSIGMVFHFFYKRIEALGVKNIPPKKPIIFAPNHQNALMDPLVVIFTSKKQVVFLTRADIFAKPILLKIFTYIKMLPVYRIRDGAESLKNNERIFEKSVEVLEAKASVGLFPEATHTDRRKLRPLKKAVPRIAFMAEEKNNFELDLQIIPVGIYYEDYVHSNSKLFVNYGKAFTITKYKALYLENAQKAYTEFRNDLSERMKELIIHISDTEHYAIYEQIRLFYRSSMKKRLKLKGPKLKHSFEADQKTIELAEKAFLNGESNIEVFGNQYRRFEQGLKKKGFQVLDFTSKCIGKTMASTLLLIIGFPIFLFGLLNGGIYYFFIMKFMKKIKDKQFHTSIKFGIVAIVMPFVFIIQSLIFWFVFNNGIWAVYYFIAILFSAVIANKYRYLYNDIKKQWYIIFLSWFKKKEYQSILKTRQSLLDYLDDIFFKS